jgi:hypothetical protein
MYTILDKRQEDKAGVNWEAADVPQIWQITRLHNHKFMITVGAY